ncbi:MAG: AAA family ATPase [Candidatus Sulfotelmatobacter sp.]
MAGLPGTGKTTLARELARLTSGRVLSKDEFRHAIFAADEIEYSSRQDDFVMKLILDTAEYLTLRNRDRRIILDGRPFSCRYQIENAIAAAQSMLQPWRIIECICAEKTARTRIEADAAEKSHTAGNRDFQLYLDVKARFEAIAFPKIVIDTDQRVDVCGARALENLNHRAHRGT